MSQTAEPSNRLLNLLTGYRGAFLIVAAVRIGVIEKLGSAPVDSDQLARVVGAHEPSLRRLMRGLASLGIVRGDAAGYQLTPMGRLLLRDAAPFADLAALIAEEHAPAWAKLAECVQTGRPAFDIAFGQDTWRHRDEHPHLSESFNRIMVANQVEALGRVQDAFDFAGCRLLIDVGGGHGQLMSEILARHPSLSGVVFDRPAVLDGARALLNDAGVLDRCRLVGGSFLESVPQGGDVYILQHVLHDWNDRECGRVLRNCRAAMPGNGILLVVENLIPEHDAAPSDLVMLDLQMMVMLGGRERTLGEYRQLLRAAGLQPLECIPLKGHTHLITAHPATAGTGQP